jgi:TRAP-type C4-dicarboxylate transport system substrate-binding protein
MTRPCIFGALISLAVVAGGCFGSDDSNKAGGDGEQPAAAVLTVANPGNPLDLEQYANAVADESAGSVELEVKRDWRLGEVDSEQRTIEDVRGGMVDMAAVGVRAFDLVGVDEFEPLVAPLQVDSYALEREVLASPIADRMLSSVEQLDLVGIALLPGEMRKPLGVSRELVTASDYRGAEIGIRPADLGARTVRALGGRPAGYAAAGDISSFDGVETGLPGVDGNQYDGPARSLTANVNLWPRVVAIVMNRDAYESLNDDQRKALSAAGGAALDPTLEVVQHDDAESMGVLCRRAKVAIGSATEAQLDALNSAVSPVIRQLERDPDTRAAQRAIESMRADVQPEKPPACPPEEGERGSTTPAGDATPLDGIWRMDSGPHELAEGDVPSGDIVAENWGHQTFVLDRGRFAFTEENDEACIWGYGDYSLSGDRLDLSFDDGGGQAPNNANNRPGEEFVYGWSLYRDQLTLKPVPGEISPGNFRVNPWRLVEGDPSIGALSHRCPPPADALESH